MWVLLVLVVLVAAAVGWFLWQRQRTDLLRRRFGPEYDRTVEESESQREAERELSAREERHDKLDVRPLSSASAEGFRQEWKEVQALFVDDPERAVHDADGLVARVMNERGYPTDGDAERRAEDLSVEHANVVGDYRRGHELLEELDGTDESTERLREAMQCFRAAFDELLDDREVATT
jgi:hypothetical protein